MQHNRSLYARRDFLKLSSVAIAGAAFGSFPPSTFASPGQVVTLSAGYAQRAPQANELLQLMPARSLASGDSSFLARDARVTIFSSPHPPVGPVPESGNVVLDVLFPASGWEPHAYPAYHAWGHRVDARGEHGSAPVSFRVPVGGTNGLHLRLLRAGSNAAEDLLFALGSDSGRAKLQRGTYVIAYGAPGKKLEPNWHRHAIGASGAGIVVTDALFPYVVLSVDYAG